MPDVIALGDINLDVIAWMPAYPPPGGDSAADSASLHVGGSALNTALALASLGTDVGLIGRVGQDAPGAQALAELAAAGLDARPVQRDPSRPTGVIFVAVIPGGERTMFSARGANAYTDPHDLEETTFTGARWFHLSGYALLVEPQRSAALRALQLAEEAGCQVSLDVGPVAARRVRDAIQRLLPRVDVLLPSEAELALLAAGVDARQAALTLLDQGVGAVITKYGALGCEVALPGFLARLPAFRVSSRDTTGAGDCFDAGVLWGRLAGLDWAAAAVLGNAAGALATQSPGGGARHITPRALREVIQTSAGAAEWLAFRELVEEVLAYLESLS
jgi:ribokinase